jgi:hypothetical protein
LSVASSRFLEKTLIFILFHQVAVFFVTSVLCWDYYFIEKLYEKVFPPPQEKGVKKIKVFSVKKTVLSELGELTVFRKKV